jgi:hypothetical protein
MLFSKMKSDQDYDYFEIVDLVEGSKSTSLKHQHYEPIIFSKHYKPGKFAIVHEGKVFKFGTMRITN